MDNQDYLLLVEDNAEIQSNNKKILERRGYSIRQAMTLNEARTLITLKRPCAIILDIMLPDGNGLAFLRELRKTMNIPILFLTALGTREDILRGLESGGDEYLTKPYDLDIFLMRIEALLRRAYSVPEVIIKSALTLKPASGKAYLNGEDLMLSGKEYSLLQFFIQNEKKTMSVEYLYETLWDAPMVGSVNAIKVMLSKLRKKIADSGYTIVSEYGDGYRFERK